MKTESSRNNNQIKIEAGEIGASDPNHTNHRKSAAFPERHGFYKQKEKAHDNVRNDHDEDNSQGDDDDQEDSLPCL